MLFTIQLIVHQKAFPPPAQGAYHHLPGNAAQLLIAGLCGRSLRVLVGDRDRSRAALVIISDVYLRGLQKVNSRNPVFCSQYVVVRASENSMCWQSPSYVAEAVGSGGSHLDWSGS